MLDKPLKEALFACSILVQKKIDDLLPIDFQESKLVEAMRYSSLSGGKRIRPFLTIISAQIFGIAPLDALDTAAAIEMIHVYSLIHDDLPAMDNDDMRRGLPSCHKKFDEATAILAGDSLLTYAFEILASSETHKDANVRCELIKTAATASGFKGMAGGQMIDLEMANQKITREKLARLHRLKTGELFMASCEAGAILGRAGLEARQALRHYAHDLGLAFQIKDDILDHCGVAEAKIGIDEKEHKVSKENASVVDLIGLDYAVKQLTLLKEQAVGHLKIFGPQAYLLIELAEFIISRDQ
ncbi:MAG: polyprenyl synthetase family protein [Proteobacteria bacterium]|nr:polyprenyl synthetase family protein [Pseudomonadota bacterium]